MIQRQLLDRFETRISSERNNHLQLDKLSSLLFDWFSTEQRKEKSKSKGSLGQEKLKTEVDKRQAFNFTGERESPASLTCTAMISTGGDQETHETQLQCPPVSPACSASSGVWRAGLVLLQLAD